jgi:hypothetical protein
LALQGTLDTFALPDVLHLLATTKKTGCLRLDGTRGTGTVHVDGGEVVAVAAAHAPLATEPADALFELLRFEDGSFAFDADASPAERQPAADVESLLSEATTLLQEWREIEAVVPSLDAHVSLRSALSGDEVTIPAAQWAHVVAVGDGRTVRSLGEHLELAELPVSRVVRDLVELGVVELEERTPLPVDAPPVQEPAPPAPDDAAATPVDAGEADTTGPGADGERTLPPPPGAPEVAASPSDEPLLGSLAPLDDQDDDGGATGDSGLPVARPIKARRPRPRLLEASGEPERFVPLDLPGHRAPSAAASDDAAAEDLDDLTAAFPGLASRGALSPDEDAAVSEQLAALSPEAADAVLAAAEEADEAAVAAALDQAVEGEQAPINRGLLLKFLGSAKS